MDKIAYIKKMLMPYKEAFLIPLDREPDFFVKNETVNGINGKTQGVTNAIKPPIKPSKNIVARLLPEVSSSPQEFNG